MVKMNIHEGAVRHGDAVRGKVRLSHGQNPHWPAVHAVNEVAGNKAPVLLPPVCSQHVRVIGAQLAVPRGHRQHEARGLLRHHVREEPVQLGADALMHPAHKIPWLDILDKSAETLAANLEPEGFSKELPVHLRFRFQAP